MRSGEGEHGQDGAHDRTLPTIAAGRAAWSYIDEDWPIPEWNSRAKAMLLSVPDF